MPGGRPPKPTALKLLTGNPGKRRLQRNEPRPPPQRPPCPVWLDLQAKREWARIVPQLDRLGLLTQLDRAALAAYCQTYSRWVKAEKILQVEGYTCETEKGYVMARPEVAIANKALATLKGYCTEFGLTPSARGRMHTGAKEESDPFDAFLRNGS